ncbi:MAG: PD-(D/E)XK nuclease family protein, partial [Methylococcales bacterium]|nr:PD-(D/E)XK nuclease family protein [Methylococcales bacterium]
CPPLEHRWPEVTGGRKLSVTQISKWIRNPYGIYASKILGLNGLDGLDEDLGGREYGSAIHLALERFIKQGRVKNADLLTQHFKTALLECGYEAHSFARHNTRLHAMAKWVVDWLSQRRADGWKFQDAEKYGLLSLNINGEDFTLSGIADLIETRGDEAAILDYKTGAVSTKAQVQAGLDPQLPLMAAMMSAGKLGASENPTDLLYIKPNAKNEKSREASLLAKNWTVEDYQADALESLEKLVSYFDEEDTPYYCQPRPQYMDDYSNYDHLARRDEWAKISGVNNE